MLSLKTEIQIFADAQELSRAAAEEFVRMAVEAVRERGTFTVALAGGSTPRSLYTLLASWSEPFRARVPWDKIHFFWGDERHVPPEHAESNYRMARETMLERAPVPSENVHRIKSENMNAAKAAEEYEETLREFFKLAEGQLPRFDLILLGVGPDGHIASIFLGTEVVNEKSLLVAAPWVEKFKSHRITLTPPVLNNAACIIFLVSGAEKAEVLREILEGDYRPERFPAQIISPTNGRLLWLADQSAARLLQHDLKERGESRSSAEGQP